jgi:hypothetical protein
MMALQFAHPLAPGMSRAWTPLSLSAAVVLAVALALAVPSTLAWLLDDRELLGTSVWAKPLKFQASLALHMLTLAWAATLLPLAWQNGRAMRAGAALLGTLTIAEMMWFTLQAARGRPAHYLEGGSLESLAYHVITAGGATVLMLATAWLGLWIWRHGRAEVAPVMRRATALGLMLSGILTILSAFPMAAEVMGTGHAVGGIASGDQGLPVVGWSTAVGDLRVAHFFALHMAQALPLLAGLAMAWRWPRPERVVTAGAAVGVLVVVATFAQAAAGRPFIALS